MFLRCSDPFPGALAPSASSMQNDHTPEPAHSSHQTSDPSTSLTVVSPQLVPWPDTLPQPPKDATSVDPATANDLTVISTPSKISSVTEREKMTSGGVQPPGSKGNDILHTRTHSQDSGDESDATTTFTEEDEGEENVIDDLEDEEERLIMLIDAMVVDVLRVFRQQHWIEIGLSVRKGDKVVITT